MYYFILGIIFCLLIQPILDGFTGLILSFFEMLKSYLMIKISHNNQKVTGERPSKILGFSAPEEEMENDI